MTVSTSRKIFLHYIAKFGGIQGEKSPLVQEWYKTLPKLVQTR